MPRGTDESTSKTYFKITYENNDKDNGRPYFAEQKKVNGDWKGVSDDKFLEGHVIGIKKDQYEYRGKPQYTFEIIIDGGDETYALQLNYGYFTRNILNSIAAIDDLGKTKLKLDIYRNKDGFVTVAVKNTTNNPEGEKTEWLLDHTKLPKNGTEKWLDSFTYFIDAIADNLPKPVEGLSQDVEMDAPMQVPENVEKLADAIDADIEKKPKDDSAVDDLPF